MEKDELAALFRAPQGRHQAQARTEARTGEVGPEVSLLAPQAPVKAPSPADIIAYLVENQDATELAVSREFGVSGFYVKSLMASEAFQDALYTASPERARELNRPLHETMVAVAQTAYQRLGEKAAQSNSAEFLLELADKTAHRLGYAPKTASTVGQPLSLVQNNTYVVDKEALQNARAKLFAAQPALVPPAEEGV